MTEDNIDDTRGGLYASMSGAQAYPRRFYLQRHEDRTGISGVGVVADGVIWQDGAVTLNWLGSGVSYNTWPGPNAIERVEAIHGHNGLTSIVYRDDEDGLPFHEQTKCPYREIESVVGPVEPRNFEDPKAVGDAFGAGLRRGIGDVRYYFWGGNIPDRNS